MSPRLLPLFCVVAVLCSSACADTITADVSEAGDYKVMVNGKVWFASAPTSVRMNGQTYSSSSGSHKLSVSSRSTYKGQDGLGPYSAWELEWEASGAAINGPAMVTTVRQYSNSITFTQRFPSALSGTMTGNPQAVVSSFPAFVVEDVKDMPRGCLPFQSDMCGYGTKAMRWSNSSSLPGGISGTGPTVVFTQDLTTAVVISPFSNFMAASQMFDSKTGVISYGVMGNVTSIPADYSMSFIVYLSSSGGINSAMFEWGATMRSFYGKPDDVPSNDFTLTHLGYSTDNGAYYYYHTQTNRTYEQTVLDVKAYAEHADIPYRHILLDSWWYFKGVGDGVKEWLPMPGVFPHGMQYVYNNTKWPIVGHNRYWASDNVYAKQNGGKWDFIIQGPKGLPTEQAFWDWLMDSSRQWGLRVYEQDWLDTEFDDLPALTNSATLGRQWLMQMGRAAERSGLTIQYCMSHVRHIMQSLEIAAVSHARASGDYHEGETDQWNIGTSSILAHSVGIAPDKDNYWSTAVQGGNPYGPSRVEPYSRLQSAVSTFSRGPVAPSDMVGASDPKLIKMACMADGTLLRPDRPATAIDAEFVQQAFGKGGPQGEVWTSTSTAAQRLSFHVLAVNLAEGYVMTPADMGVSQQYVQYEANLTHGVGPFSTGAPLKLNANNKATFELHHLSPVEANGWAVLGELSKWVPTSADRFVDIDTQAKTISATVRGPPSESVTVSFLDPSGKMVHVTCTVPVTGTVTLHAPSAKCTQ